MTADNYLIFPDQSPSFAHGVEFGRIYEKLERGDQHVNNNGMVVYTTNVELIRDACLTYGYVPHFSPVTINDVPHPQFTDFYATKYGSNSN